MIKLIRDRIQSAQSNPQLKKPPDSTKSFVSRQPIKFQNSSTGATEMQVNAVSQKRVQEQQSWSDLLVGGGQTGPRPPSIPAARHKMN